MVVEWVSELLREIKRTETEIAEFADRLVKVRHGLPMDFETILLTCLPVSPSRFRPVLRNRREPGSPGAA